MSKTDEAIEVVTSLGLPRAQQNERSALTLLALGNLRPDTPWSKAERPLLRIWDIMGFMRDAYGKDYAANTRETIRRQTIHQFEQARIVDRNPDDPTEIPTYNVVTADGGLIDPTVGAVGVWAATGPDTANFTLTGTIAELGAYFVVRGSIAVDAGGDTVTNTASDTIVAAAGTILDQHAQLTATYVRLRVEPQDAVGQPLAGFPAWTPPPAATPTP